MTTALWLLVLIICAYGLSYAIMHTLARFHRSYFALRIFLLPGIILHELAHAAACVVTGTKIVSINFWDSTGGNVVHHKPRFAFLIQPFISFAPFPVGLYSLYLLNSFLSIEHWQVSIALVYLMVSIAATLAPSKTDVIAAAEGLILLVAIGGTIAWFTPEWIESLAPNLEQFAIGFQSLIILLVIMQISIHALALLRERVGR